MCVCKRSAVRALIPAVRPMPTRDHSFTEQALLTSPASVRCFPLPSPLSASLRLEARPTFSRRDVSQTLPSGSLMQQMQQLVWWFRSHLPVRVDSISLIFVSSGFYFGSAYLSKLKLKSGYLSGC